MLNSNISSTCPHNMTNFGPLVAEICWRVWGTPANFNGFRVLASLLQQRRSPEANHTCTMFGRLLAGMPYMGGLLLPDGISPRAKFTLRPTVQVLRSTWQRYCTARQQRNQPNFAAWYKEWNYGTFAEGATYIRLGGHHVGHRPTFYC